MKLTYFQLEQQVSKKLAPVYLISGEEMLLKQDALTLIRKAAKQAGYTERTRWTPESNTDWEPLYSLLHASSLFAEKRLIELDFRDHTPVKTAATLLQEYAANPAPENVLVIELSKLDIKISKSAWYTALEKIGHVVTLWPIPREQLPAWIIQRAKKYKLQFNQDAAQLLADYIEGNLIAAAQAIEKIYLLKPQAAIDLPLVQAILSDESRFTIFDFIEYLVAGDLPRSLRILTSLREDGVEPAIVLWGITRELRLLADLCQQVSQGQHPENLFQKYRIFARRQPSVRRFLSNHTAQDCWHLLQHSVEIDHLIKGALPGNPWDALQRFCLRMV